MTAPSHLAAIILAILTVALSSNPVSAKLVVSIGKVEAAAGKEVTVPISLKGAKDVKGVSCMSIRLTVDPKLLTFKAVEKGPALPNALVDKSVNEQDSPGKIGLGFVCGSKTPGSKDMASVDDDGIVIQVIFTVNDDATPGSKCPLKLDNFRVLDSAEPPGDLPVRVEDGEFTVSADSLPNWLWLAIAGGALLLLLLLALLMRLGRRRDAMPSSPPPPRAAQVIPPAAVLPRFMPESPTFSHTCIKCGGVIQLPRAMFGQAFQCGACGASQIAGSGRSS